MIVLRGGQSKQQRRDIAARLASRPDAISVEVSMIPASIPFFLTMPIAWKGTLAQYAGRLHRLNDAKREVIIYDYVDMRVPVLARMAAKRRIGYRQLVSRNLVRAICFPVGSHRTHLPKLHLG